MIDALVARAFELRYEEDERWEPISELQRHADPVAVQAVVRPMLAAEDPFERTLAADVLGQVGGPDAPDRAVRATLLIERLAVEDDPLALSAIGFALGHLDDERAVGPMAALAGHEHPLVRRSVVAGVSADLEDDRAVDALIALSADPVSEIRDWATFSLGHIGHRTGPRVAAALVARLDDEDDDTRGEALYGLALRADPRAIVPLLDELEEYEGWFVDHALAALITHFPDDQRLTAALAEHWPDGVPEDVRGDVVGDLELKAEWGRP